MRMQGFGAFQVPITRTTEQVMQVVKHRIQGLAVPALPCGRPAGPARQGPFAARDSGYGDGGP